MDSFLIIEGWQILVLYTNLNIVLVKYTVVLKSLVFTSWISHLRDGWLFNK